MKKKEEQLVRKVTDMIQKTREGKLHWDIQCQTTEYNDPAKKPVETEEGETWVIDECFVSYHCMDQEKEFLLVSYEQIYTCGEKKKSCNLIFLPPLGIRFFDVDVLAPYAVGGKGWKEGKGSGRKIQIAGLLFLSAGVDLLIRNQ